MLKKILIGVVIFIILAVGGIGGYIYMMDWNQHKDLVAERFSQITGLKASIEGELKVELMPSPKFSANAVRFFKTNAPRDPLVTVKDISASVELWPMFQQKFIIKSMTLNNASVNVNINEKGVSNWSGINTSTGAQPGNIEVSFNDVRLNNAVLNYKNLQDNEEFSLPNISATVNASTIKGPYKTNGKLIYNENEISFKGAVAKNKGYNVNMTFENVPTGSKAVIDGTLGKQAKGSVNFRTLHLSDASKIILGTDVMHGQYNDALDFSFQYDYDNAVAKLNNFVVKYGNIAAGSGSVHLNNSANNKEFTINLDMTQLELNILQDFGKTLLEKARQNQKIADITDYNGVLDVKVPHAVYNGAEVSNVNIGLALQNGLLTITRMGLNMPGNTAIQMAGAVNLNENLNFQFNQLIETDDLRQFISVFGIDLAKLAHPDNKKAIFKRAKMDLSLSGDMNHLKISSPQVNIDTTSLSGNVGIVLNEGKTFVIAAVDGSKLLFDKYMEVLPRDSKNLSVKEKFIHQINLIPWNHELNIDAAITLKGAVYNNIPLENMVLEFNSEQNALHVKKLSFDNMVGANLNLSFNADNVYTEPYFSEFAYDVKTDNFPQFASAIGLNLSDLKLWHQKRFASQGALSGTFDNFSLSSVQKFGDTEILYTGTIADLSSKAKFDGELELKSDNFAGLIKALNFDYKPDIPVTAFSLNGKVKGTADTFDISDVVAYLSANAIKGSLSVDNSKSKPYFNANLDFDRFDADRFFNLSQKNIFINSSEEDTSNTFVKKPVLNDEKLDFEVLKNSEFDIKASARNLIYEGATYTDAQLVAALEKGILKVSDFKAEREESSVALKFDLNSNDIPKISGSYKIKGIKTPDLSGSVYSLKGGIIRASGDFNSLATSPKAFFENLSSQGDFILDNTSMNGWDLALIKFELEQRDSVDGLEDLVLQSLKSGHSDFSEVHGSFDITNGMLVAKNIVWESPVITLGMKFDLNFNSWLFTAVFNGVYHNASFSDVLKFTFDDNLADPKLSVDLRESISRISNTTKLVSKLKAKHDAAQKSRLADKIAVLQASVDNLQQDISRMELDVIRFKPVTDNKDVNTVYDTNINTLTEVEQSLSSMADTLRNQPSEATLREIEATLSTEQSKILYVPKALEENFVVDSKYVFDDTFNKIAWLYNVAQNNSAYYKGLSDVYLSQLEAINETTDEESDSEKPTQDDVDRLTASVQKVTDDMGRIAELHNKIRDNYLLIIDAPTVAEMHENNEIAAQALKTLSGYIAEMNKDIVDSFDLFRAALDIKARDYEQYMVYPPLNPEDIDVSQPTVRINNPKEKAKDVVADKKAKEAKPDAEKSAPKSLKEILAPQLDASPATTTDDKKKIDNVTEREENPQNDVVLLIQPNFAQPSPTYSVSVEDMLGIGDMGISSLNLPQNPKVVIPSPVLEKDSENVAVLAQEPVATDEIITEAQADVKSESNSIVADTPTLPDAHTLILAHNPDIAPSAIEKALHTDIDSMLSLEPIDDFESELTVAGHTQIVTEDIAQQINDLKPNADDIAEDTKSESGTQLKVNPAIAMDMGKTDADEAISLVLNKKKGGFKKAGDDFVNMSTEEGKTTDIVTKLPQREIKAVVLDILDNNVIVDDEKVHETIDIKEETTSSSQYTFAVTPKAVPIPFSGVVGKNMHIGRNNTQILNAESPQFVFRLLDGSELKSQGIVGKNMFAHRTAEQDEPIKQKYIFAANGYDVSFSGSVSKAMFSSVK